MNSAALDELKPLYGHEYDVRLKHIHIRQIHIDWRCHDSAKPVGANEITQRRNQICDRFLMLPRRRRCHVKLSVDEFVAVFVVFRNSQVVLNG